MDAPPQPPPLPPPPLPPPPPPKPDGDGGGASPAILFGAKNTYGSAGEAADGAAASAALAIVPPPHRDDIPSDRRGPNRWSRGSTGRCRRAPQLTRSPVVTTLGDSDGGSGCAADATAAAVATTS